MYSIVSEFLRVGRVSRGREIRIRLVWVRLADPGLLPVSFFLIETLSITGQEFFKCLKDGSDRLRKGQLFRLQLRLGREYKVE